MEHPSPEKPLITHVKVDSPEHLINTNLEQGYALYPEDHIFGTFAVSLYEELHDKSKPSVKSTAEELTDELTEVRKELLDMSNNKLVRPYVEQFAQSSMANPQVRNYLIENQKREDLLSLEPVNFIKLVDDETLAIMFKSHVEKMQTTEQELQEKVPVLKERFKTRLNDLIAVGELPSIDIQLVSDVLDNIKVLFVDALSKPEWAGELGTFDPSTNITYMYEQLSEDHLEHVFFHEMLHGVSGRTVLAQINSPTEEISPEHFVIDADTQTQRLGLRFFGHDSSSERFKWLDEAITEEITMMLSGKDFGIYKDERDLTRGLRLWGREKINASQLYETYFEHYDPTLQRDQRILHWKEFVSSINHSYGPAFLPEVDDIVKRDGVKAAAFHAYLLKQ